MADLNRKERLTFLVIGIIAVAIGLIAWRVSTNEDASEWLESYQTVFLAIAVIILFAMRIGLMVWSNRLRQRDEHPSGREADR